jgi:twitching motility protein PilT
MLNLSFLLDLLIEKDGSDLNITQNDYISLREKKNIKIYRDYYILPQQCQDIILELTENRNTLINLYNPKEFDGSYKYKKNEEEFFFRYNISLSIKEVHITIRKLINKIPSFKEIQLDKDDIELFVNDVNEIKEGLYLFVGATGSGKTTSIVTIIDDVLKKNSIKAISLEEPIEYYFNKDDYEKSIILQKEIGKDTESFYSGLVSAMRQNPDLIFVGEIRDKNTAEAALNAALTGHTVIGTLHAKSVEKTKDRMKYLLEGIIEDFDFINGIVYQKLIKKDNKVIAKREIYIKDK